MAVFTSRNTVKTQLNIPLANTQFDSQIDALLDAADEVIRGWCKQWLYPSLSYTEFYSGNDLSWLVLRQLPVTSVQNVWLDRVGYGGSAPGAFGVGTLLTQGVDYFLLPGQRPSVLQRINSVWPGSYRAETYRLGALPESGLGNVKVQYTAGYLTLPTDLQMAASQLVAAVMRTIRFGGAMLNEERLGSYEYKVSWLHRSLSNWPELGTTRQVLSRYMVIW